ncbi:MAG: hypothetical protein LBJ48_05195 [Coriobacteriales bacterium]|jgi:antitoxin (DNA-binding transcriptional repressor) of toxin-antitoxin stability system|nr:hypothetical protein [Coriobacteriales bacterium]
MTNMTVGELRQNFSAVLTQVQAGRSYGILYGRAKKPIARLVPYEDPAPIRLGLLKGKGRVAILDDSKLEPEELLG